MSFTSFDYIQLLQVFDFLFAFKIVSILVSIFLGNKTGATLYPMRLQTTKSIDILSVTLIALESALLHKPEQIWGKLEFLITHELIILV